jgi:hypothetical protein
MHDEHLEVGAPRYSSRPALRLGISDAEGALEVGQGILEDGRVVAADAARCAGTRSTRSPDSYRC